MTTTVPAEERLDFKKILPIFIIVLVDLLGLTIIIPLMPLYATSFGASPLLIGLLGASYPMMQFIGAPFLGRLSDRYGRKPILLASQAGTLLGFLLLGFANSLLLLFLARIVDGLSGANLSTAQAAIADSTNEKTRTQGLGLMGAAFGLGFVAGPIIAFLSLTLSGNNFHVPALVAAFFSLASILLTWFWYQETLPEENRGQGRTRPSFNLSAMFKALQHPAVGLLLVVMFLQQIAFGNFQQLFSLFTLNRLGLNASGNSIIFIFVGIIIVAVQGGFIGSLSRRFGDRRLIYFGLALMAAGLILTAFTPRQPLPGYSKAALEAQLGAGRSLRTGENPTTQHVAIELPPDVNRGWLGLGWILAAMIPASIGGALLQPSLNSLITKRVQPDEIGGTLGISAALLSGSNAIAPLLGGFLFETIGSSAPFLLGGLLMLIVFFVAIRYIHPGREENPAMGLSPSAVMD